MNGTPESGQLNQTREFESVQGLVFQSPSTREKHVRPSRLGRLRGWGGRVGRVGRVAQRGRWGRGGWLRHARLPADPSDHRQTP
jgi:hypothetical protein